MRILLISDSYPPVPGGVSRHVRDLAQGLAQHGHSVAVATFQNGTRGSIENDGSVRLYFLRGLVQRAGKILFSQPERGYAPPFPDPELSLELNRIIKAETPEIIHTHNWLGRSLLSLKPIHKFKLVTTLHCYDLVCAKMNLMQYNSLCSGPGLKKCSACVISHYGTIKGLTTLYSNLLLSRLERKLVDLYLPVSNAVAEGVGLPGSGQNYRVIPNFIVESCDSNEENINQYVSKLPDEDFLLFVGAFGKHKGIGPLLEAYTQLQLALPLVLIGFESPGNMLDMNNLPAGVRIFKNWPAAAVARAWEKCLFGIVPSTFPDPCPTVAMEGMRAGKALVASAIGGIPDLVLPEITGLLVPPGDVDVLARAILRLWRDPEKRQLMESNAREKFREFQSNYVIPCIESEYINLLEQTDSVSLSLTQNVTRSEMRN